MVTPPSAVGAVCGVQIQSQNYSSTGTAPLNVGVAPGASSSLTYSTGNSSLFLNVTNSTSTASSPQLLNNTALNTVIDPLTGLNLTTFSAANLSTGDNVTVIAAVYSIVPGSSPLQLDPTVVCLINVTFAVVAPSQGSTSIVSASTAVNGYPSATGSTTSLPLGIPVTTGNVDGNNRGYGNSGSNNIGNGNTGNCNQGDGNVGDNNKGEGNRGSCNIGHGNTGNGYIGDGNKSGGNGPNSPCSCTITAVTSAG